ncbi:hypothetical protein E1B28_009779 [Marasmius oreades]|uniref:AIG1-type G domain-containing protein n=1 Tax=Marasmius oreades TaxID=181124 RepID=A0A9P7RWW2_9AGAR|nr:uncharacterized protein E1B28_009779 [Marasmius oreades]KAG7090681.1 hypothetical protein E1B28_009779 [Marasmius oreades]
MTAIIPISNGHGAVTDVGITITSGQGSLSNKIPLNGKSGAFPNSTPHNHVEDEDEDEEEEGELPRLNLPSDLREGKVKTTDRKNEFTILLVGETGVGKTSILSLIANVLAGNKPDQYVDMHDPSNEAGGSQSRSQTNMAIVYEFKSQNGIIVRILDTPGLADTRGIAQDSLHKASIARAISDHIVVVNAVLILANGTVPRLTVATDYALSTLSSIFPRTLADNIGIVFTNVPSPLSWNFEQDSLPPVLRKAEQFLLDNPVAMQKKYNELKAKKLPKQTLKQLRDGVVQGELKTLDMLACIFDWLDKLKPQPTKDILSLYQQSQDIEKRIQNALARIQQANSKKNELEDIKRAIKKANLDIYTLKDFQKIIKRKRHIQDNKTYHSTLCSVPDCYSNCHEHCGLNFSLDPYQLGECAAMDLKGVVCTVCGHERDHHRHYNSLWNEVEEDERVVDRDAEKKYKEAESEVEKKEALRLIAQKAIDELTKDVEEAIIQLGRSADEYANLSLSGNFSSQVEKSISLMKLNIEKMQNDGSDRELIVKLEKSMESMERKLDILKEAMKKARESAAGVLAVGRAFCQVIAKGWVTY